MPGERKYGFNMGPLFFIGIKKFASLFLFVLNEFYELNVIHLLCPGGMQDWNYLHTNCFEVTIELGCVKYPLAKDLPTYWEQNRMSLLRFIQQVFKPCFLPSLNTLPTSLFSLHRLTAWCLSIFVGPRWH